MREARLPTLSASQGVLGSGGGLGRLEVKEIACGPSWHRAGAEAGACGGHRTQPGWGAGRVRRRNLATVGSLPVHVFLLNTHFILFLFVLLCIWEGEPASPSFSPLLLPPTGGWEGLEGRGVLSPRAWLGAGMGVLEELNCLQPRSRG